MYTQQILQDARETKILPSTILQKNIMVVYDIDGYISRKLSERFPESGLYDTRIYNWQNSQWDLESKKCWYEKHILWISSSVLFSWKILRVSGTVREAYKLFQFAFANVLNLKFLKKSNFYSTKRLFERLVPQ